VCALEQAQARLLMECEPGADMGTYITVHNFPSEFKTVVKSENLMIFKIKLSWPTNDHDQTIRVVHEFRYLLPLDG
jgi:hypothetical protein